MIENLRKQSGLMAIILLLLAAGLILTMNDSGGGGGGGGNDYLSVDDISMDQSEVSRESNLAQSMLSQLRMYDYLFALSGLQVSPDPSVNLVTARILLKNKAEQYGIYPSEDAAEKLIKERICANPETGEFDSKLYANLVNGLKQAGFKEQDLIDIVAEYLVFAKVRDIVAGGITIPQVSSLALMKSEQQKVSLETVTLNLDDFKKQIQPTEEDIKKFWETHKDAYKTERQLKISYLRVQADESDRPKPAAENPNASTEERTQASIAYNKKLDNWILQRSESTKILLRVYNEFFDAVQDSDGKDFTAAAKKAAEVGGADIKFVTTDAFSAATAPAELRELMIRDAETPTSLVDALFNFEVGESLLYKISQFKIGFDGYFAFRIDEVIAPQVKSYEDAKELAKTDLINERSNEALKKAAEAAQAEIAKLMKEGKSFSDAAKAKGFTSTAIEAFGIDDQPKDVTSPQALFNAAKITEPKSIAKSIVHQNDSSASIVYLDSRVFEIAADADLQNNSYLDQQSNELAMSVFTAWLQSLPQEAEMKLPQFRE